MNKMRYVIAVLVGFIFISVLDFVFHGIMLAPMYEETAQLWRSEEEMKTFFPLAMAMQFLIVAILAFIFTRNYEGKGIGEGVRFGLMFGLLIGALEFALYPYMPVPISLGGAWVVGALLRAVGLGVIFSLIYKK